MQHPVRGMALMQKSAKLITLMHLRNVTCYASSGPMTQAWMVG